MEVRIRTSPLTATMRASTARPCSDMPRVRERKIGVLPMGLTMGNRAPKTRRVSLARSLSGPLMIVLRVRIATQFRWPGGFEDALPAANRRAIETESQFE